MEEWKNITDYPEYSISSHGRVMRNKTGRIRKQTVSKGGYLRVGVYPSKRNSPQPDILSVSRLVAIYFLGKFDHLEVNHIDGNKKNNRVENLEWVTHSDNQIHAYNKGLQLGRKGESHHLSKLNKNKVIQIRKLWSSGKYIQKEIANKFNINQQNVSLICRNIAWSHVKEEN